MRFDCTEVIERLPWLLNRSLDPSEDRELVRHLASCLDCQAEARATEEVWRIATQHVPARELSEYAQGLPIQTLDRGVLERHLAICSSCRRDLRLASSDRELLLVPPPGRWSIARGPASRRRLAMAAGLAGLATSGWILWGLLAGVGPSKGPDVLQPDRSLVRVADETGARSVSISSESFESGGLATFSSN